MKGPTHELIGVSTAVVASQALGLALPVAASVTASAFVASKLPDSLEDALQGVRVLPHRTVTHWAITAVAITGMVLLGLWMVAGPVYAVPVAAGFAIGYGMHLAADMCTPHGLPVLAPVARRRFWLLPRPARVRTGSQREGFVAVMVVIATALYFALTYEVI